MLRLSKRGLWAAALVAIASTFLPAARVIAQDTGSSGEIVAAIKPAEDPLLWRVTLAEGEARWRRLPAVSLESSWKVVEAGINLPPGTEVLTGTDGQVTLSRADDSIRVGPDTWLTLELDAEDLITRIRQTLGTAWYSVRSRVLGRFRVDTARLVAVVKGTKFEIAVGADADEMAVREGVVSAQSAAGGSAIDVRAGQRVKATAAGLVLIAAPDGGSDSNNRTQDDPSGGSPTPGGENQPQRGGSQPGDGREAGNNGSRGNGPQDGNNGNTAKSGENGKGFGGGDKGRGRDR